MSLNKKVQSRIKRKARIRKRVRGTSERPRLVIFRSSRFIYAQVIDDSEGKTLFASSSLEKGMKKNLKGTGNCEAAKEVGKTIAQKAKAGKVTKVIFDRNGNIYHGKVKAFADSAREAGLEF